MPTGAEDLLAGADADPEVDAGRVADEHELADADGQTERVVRDHQRRQITSAAVAFVVLRKLQPLLDHGRRDAHAGSVADGRAQGVPSTECRRARSLPPGAAGDEEDIPRPAGPYDERVRHLREETALDGSAGRSLRCRVPPLASGIPLEVNYLITSPVDYTDVFASAYHIYLPVL